MKKKSLIVVSQFFVAGLVFCDYFETKLKRGQRVSLVAEPDNAYDANAIKVMSKTHHIGYVPRDQTHEINQFEGVVSHAQIKAWEPANATHRRVLVTVYGTTKAPQRKALVIC